MTHGTHKQLSPTDIIIAMLKSFEIKIGKYIKTLSHNMYVLCTKVLGKVWPGFKNKYDLDIYDLR